MSPSSEHHNELTAWLQSRGHSQAEIDYILDRLRRYDELTTVDSLMDAIDQGEVDLDAIVQEFKEP